MNDNNKIPEQNLPVNLPDEATKQPDNSNQANRHGGPSPTSPLWVMWVPPETVIRIN